MKKSDEKPNLILLGAGGHCKSVIDIAESAGFNILGILDNQVEIGQAVLGYKIIGTDEDIAQFSDNAQFLITVGFIKNPDIRIKLYDRIKGAGGKLATVIAPSAHVSRYAQIGEGTIIMNNAVVNAGTVIGVNSIINTLSNIEHDVTVGDQCHISTGAMVNGNCLLRNRVFLGSQSVLVNGVAIGEDIVIGAGSVVCESLREKGIYVGNPAILKKKL